MVHGHGGNSAREVGFVSEAMVYFWLVLYAEANGTDANTAKENIVSDEKKLTTNTK